MNEQEVLDAQIGSCPDRGSMFDQEPEPILADLDNDGTFESVLQGFDTDNDGQVDTWGSASDIDGDGIADQTSVLQGIDTDSDGQADAWEIQTDFDNDGISDAFSLVNNPQGDGVTDASIGWVEDNAPIIGEPTEDMQHWHQQTHQDTCAIVSQEFILDELTGRDFSEDDLRQQAIDNGWYKEGGGTPLDCMGNLLEANGVDVERQNSSSWEDLNQKLAEGQKVMVAIDSDEIWNPGGRDDDNTLDNSLGIPGQGVNHAVQVIGIDNSDPNNPMVILNDPGHPEGRGMTVPADQFINAWEDSARYMVYTTSLTYTQ